jgi:hypothetical protein
MCKYSRKLHKKSLIKLAFKIRVWVNQWLYFLLSATDFPLLAWYQQAGRWRKAVESGKYVDISGKWSCYFTLTPNLLEVKVRIKKLKYIHFRNVSLKY